VNSFAVKLWMSVLLLLVSAYGAYTGVNMLRKYREQSRAPSENLDLRPLRPLSDFQFTERDGRTVRLAELEGKVFVLNFFFGNCPGTCRILNSKVAELHKKFGPEGARFVSVTIDPSSDTPEKLAAYAKPFGADENWWFVTGPLENTQDLGRSLHLSAVGRDETGNLTHTDHIVVFDRAGVMRGKYDHREPERMKAAAEKLEELLAEKPPAPRPSSTATGTASSTPTGSPTPAPTGSASSTPTKPAPSSPNQSSRLAPRGAMARVACASGTPRACNKIAQGRGTPRTLGHAFPSDPVWPRSLTLITRSARPTPSAAVRNA